MIKKDENKTLGGSVVSGTLRVVLFAVFVKAMQSRLWPWGLAEPWVERMHYSEVDLENDSLQIKRKLVSLTVSPQAMNTRGRLNHLN
jgi:hypothetical protein